MENHQTIEPADQPEESPEGQVTTEQNPPVALEYGGPKGPEPTRYGDWEQAGRCTDF